MKLDTSKSVLRLLKEKFNVRDDLYNKWYPKRGYSNTYDSVFHRYRSVSVIKSDAGIKFLSLVVQPNLKGILEAEYAVGYYDNKNFDDVIKNPLKGMVFENFYKADEAVSALETLACLTTGEDQSRYF